MKFTIAVVTKDGTQTSLRALGSTGAGDRLLINNGCCGAHIDIVRSESFSDVRMIDLRPSRGLPHCWNLAVLYAEHEHVIIANDDVIFEDGWREKLEAALADHDHVTMAYPLNRWGCFATTKTVVRELGWFDEAFTGIYFEDEDWWLRLQEARKRVRSVDAVRHDSTLRAEDRAMHHTVLDLSPEANQAAFMAKWRPAVGDEPSLGLKGNLGGCKRVVRNRPEHEWHIHERLWNNG